MQTEKYLSTNFTRTRIYFTLDVNNPPASLLLTFCENHRMFVSQIKGENMILINVKNRFKEEVINFLYFIFFV